MSSEAPQNHRNSNLYVLLLIAITIGGTGFWFFLNRWAAEPVGPTIAKEFAEDFEKECFLELQEERECRKLIGMNHSECLFANVERVTPGSGDQGGDIRHDREGYMTCMREKTGVQH